MVKISTTILVLACFLQASTFFGDSKRGWFYYELADNNNTQEKNETKIQKRMNADDLFIASIPLNNLDLLTAEEFTETFEKVRKIAIMNPTKTNVMTMQIMNKWQVDQSEKFAKVWALNLLENPNLEYPEIRDDKFGRSEMFRQKQEKINNFYKAHQDDFSYVVFVSDLNKKINEKQKGIYRSLQSDYGVNVEYVNVDERKDLISKFKLATTPENFFVYRNSKGEAIWQRVKSGLTNKDDIINNTLFLFDNAILEKDK
ncbi:TPA: conjugal transfer protein TraF [Campylobacter jejuni]